MTYEPLKWDVKRSRNSQDDLRLQLVKEILNRMTKEELRSALHQYLYLQFEGHTSAQLLLEANTRGIDLLEGP